MATGPDGLTVEFHLKKSGMALSGHLQEIVTAFQKESKLPTSWTLAKLMFLPKQDQDLAFPQSYRPISLLNAGCKILTLILTARLNKIMKCYLYQDRVLSDNIRRLCNTLNYAQVMKVPTFIGGGGCDAEKAFGRVKWDFLKAVLRRMEFWTNI